MPLVLIGLTGGIACGKSTVSSILASDYHVPIIDADLIVRDLQRPNAPCTRRIAQRWPACVDAATGELRREVLGQIVFSDAKARKELARIMNGPIFLTILKRILAIWWRELACSDPVVVILDAPTLFETKLFTHFVSNTVVVACSEQRQVERLAVRNGMQREEALRRIRSQMHLDKKRMLAGYVIENDAVDDLPALKESVGTAVHWMSVQSGHKITLLMGGLATACVGVAVAVVAASRRVFS